MINDEEKLKSIEISINQDKINMIRNNQDIIVLMENDLTEKQSKALENFKKEFIHLNTQL